MALLADGVVVLVAVLHGYFLVLEMFLWDRPAGRRAFGTTEEQARASKVLASSQGLYNGFIAVGLLWGVFQGEEGFEIKIFFLACVILAGVYGGLTASRKILYVQAAPGLLGLILVLLAG